MLETTFLVRDPTSVSSTVHLPGSVNSTVHLPRSANSFVHIVATATTRGQSATRRRGMSLLEIMVVITLIGLITAAIGVAVMNQLSKGQSDSARSQAYEIGKSLELYRLQNGRYPTTSEGIAVLAKPPKGKPIMDSVPQDPWGNEYIFTAPGTKNPAKFDIRSKGSDGVENTEDDVGNWAAE